MKAYLKYLYICLTAIILALSSCKKDKIETPEPENNSTLPQPAYSNTKVVALLNNLATPVQTYTVNGSSSSSFVCTNGTTVTTSPGAFLSQAGVFVTGVINIEVKDILSKKDMILNNAMPVSNGDLLVSGGEVYFNATQSGQKLKINPASGGVSIKVPAGSSPSSQMLEYYSSGTADLSNSNLNWTTNTNTVTPTLDSASASWYYNFKSDSVKWVNCDYFNAAAGAKTSFTVNLTGSFDNTNAVVFMSQNGVKSLGRVFPITSSVSQQFISYSNPVIPIGATFTILAMSFDGTNYYYGSQTVTITADMIIGFPVLTQTTKTQIETNLSTLP